MTSFQLNKNIWKKVKNPGKEGIQKTSEHAGKEARGEE